MPRAQGQPFKGYFTGWLYQNPRALGLIEDQAKRDAIAADPLSRAVMASFLALQAAGLLPVGPRGIGYDLLGRKINGRTVVKDKANYIPRGLPRAEAVRQGAKFYDFADVADTIVGLRRAEILDWTWVADGRTDEHEPTVAIDAASALVILKGWSRDIGTDVLADQDVYTELWCEAADLATAAARIMEEYGVSTYSGSGDIPLPAVHNAALRYQAAIEGGKSVEVLIVGDYDLDGGGNADRFAQDVLTFLEQGGCDLDKITFTWVAPLAEHLTRWPDLRQAAGPAVEKADMRLPFTIQAEALVRGGALITLLREAIEGVLDMTQVEATRTAWDDTHAPDLTGALEAAEEYLEEPPTREDDQ